MAIESVTKLMNNIQGSPKTTFIGLVLICFSLYMMYENDFTLTYTSIEVGILAFGVYLFVIKDKKE